MADLNAASASWTTSCGVGSAASVALGRIRTPTPIRQSPSMDRIGPLPGALLFPVPDPHLIQVTEQVGRVLIHAVGTCALEFLLAVAS